MITDEQELKLIEEQKRTIVESAIVENPFFKKIDKLLNSAEYSGIKINMDEMIDFYMELSGTTKVNDMLKFQINDSLIEEVVNRIIYDISEEENGLVFDKSGNIDKQASVEQATSGLFRLAPDYAIDGVREASQTEELSNFFMNQKNLSNSEIDFFEKLVSGNITAEKRKTYFQNTLDKHTEEIKSNTYQAEDNNFIETREQLNFIMIGAKYDKLLPNEKEQVINKLLNMPLAEKYRNPKNGQIDIEAAIEVGKQWKRSYIEQKRKTAFIEYNDHREKGKNFSQLSSEDKNKIFRSAILTFVNFATDDNLRATAQAILIDISPKLLNIEKTENGNFISRINNEAMISLYNGMRADENNIENVDEIRANFMQEEEKMAIGKLEFLDNSENWISRKEWEQIQVAKNRPISQISNNLKRVEHKETKLTENSIQTRLGNRLDQTLDILENKNGGTLTQDEKVGTVIAAYKSLNRAVNRGRNLEVNIKALKLLKEHILSNPADYGNFIDDNGKEKIINEQKIKNIRDLKEYRIKSGNKYKNKRKVLQVLKETAEEELSKENFGNYKKSLRSSVKLFMSRVANAIKIATPFNSLLSNSKTLGLQSGEQVQVYSKNNKPSQIAREIEVVNEVSEVKELSAKPYEINPLAALSQEYIDRTNAVSKQMVAKLEEGPAKIDKANGDRADDCAPSHD